MYRMQQYDKDSDHSGDKINLQEIIKSHLKLIIEKRKDSHEKDTYENLRKKENLSKLVFTYS